MQFPDRLAEMCQPLGQELRRRALGLPCDFAEFVGCGDGPGGCVAHEGTVSAATDSKPTSFEDGGPGLPVKYYLARTGEIAVAHYWACAAKDELRFALQSLDRRGRHRVARTWMEGNDDESRKAHPSRVRRVYRPCRGVGRRAGHRGRAGRNTLGGVG